MTYPADWPPCVACGEPALDGHLTCGRSTCSESSARARAVSMYVRKLLPLELEHMPEAEQLKRAQLLERMAELELQTSRASQPAEADRIAAEYKRLQVELGRHAMLTAAARPAEPCPHSRASAMHCPDCGAVFQRRDGWCNACYESPCECPDRTLQQPAMLIGADFVRANTQPAPMDGTPDQQSETTSGPDLSVAERLELADLHQLATESMSPPLLREFVALAETFAALERLDSDKARARVILHVALRFAPKTLSREMYADLLDRGRGSE